jgi:hypothetical protein
LSGWSVLSAPRPELGVVLRQLYACGINASISSVHDGGWVVVLGGPEDTDAVAMFSDEDFDKIAEWLIAEACHNHPQSEFTTYHARPGARFRRTKH